MIRKLSHLTMNLKVAEFVEVLIIFIQLILKWPNKRVRRMVCRPFLNGFQMDAIKTEGNF
jgi:hypothetical protein